MNIYPENSIILAPLAGHTDIPFRKSAHRHGCLFAFTEMVDAESLLDGYGKTLHYIERDKSEEWLGLQFVSNVPSALATAVKQVANRGWNVIDFNLGCPAPKVAKKGEGAVLARYQRVKALECFSALAESAKKERIPVSVKMRILSETDPSELIDFAQKLELAGASALTIHGRLMERFYSGDVHYEMIRAVREAVDIQVVANGGVMGYTSYQKLKQETGCSVVMIARGAMGNPWIFEELQNATTYIPPDVLQYAKEVELYLNDMILEYGELLGLKIARKTVLDFLKRRGYPGTLRASISQLQTRFDVTQFLDLLQQGPSPGYWQWLSRDPLGDRRLRNPYQSEIEVD